MRWADLYRRAAGVADYVGQGAPGRHFGRWLCLNCPRDWHEPPFLPFRLPIHIREHRERFPDHAIAWWCWDHLMVEAVHTTGWRWAYGPLYVQPPSGEAKAAATGTAAAPHNCAAGGVCSPPAFASPP